MPRLQYSYINKFQGILRKVLEFRRTFCSKYLEPPPKPHLWWASIVIRNSLAPTLLDRPLLAWSLLARAPLVRALPSCVHNNSDVHITSQKIIFDSYNEKLIKNNWKWRFYKIKLLEKSPNHFVDQREAISEWRRCFPPQNQQSPICATNSVHNMKTENLLNSVLLKSIYALCVWMYDNELKLLVTNIAKI